MSMLVRKITKRWLIYNTNTTGPHFSVLKKVRIRQSTAVEVRYILKSYFIQDVLIKCSFFLFFF